MNETLLKAGFILGAAALVFLINGKSSNLYKQISHNLAEKRKQKVKEKLEPEKINFC